MNLCGVTLRSLYPALFKAKCLPGKQANSPSKKKSSISFAT